MERAPQFSSTEDIAAKMGDWTRETPGTQHHALNTHEIHGLPRVEARDSNLLERLRQPLTQKVISFLLVAAAAGASIAWFTESESVAQGAGQQIEQASFEEQRTLWIEKMNNEGLTEEDINSVLNDPELKAVYEEMTMGDYDSFDEYLEKS